MARVTGILTDDRLTFSGVKKEKLSHCVSNELNYASAIFGAQVLSNARDPNERYSNETLIAQSKNHKKITNSPRSYLGVLQ
jgi:hypothetical protein